MRGQDGGFVSSQKLYYSYGDEAYKSYGIRPIVTLLSSVQLIDTNTTKDDCKIYDLKVTPQCLIEGTKVLSEEGLKNIEDISIGDRVYSMNIESNQKELKTVNAVYRGETNEIYEITIENQIIRATSRHKFHTLDRGWIEANALREGEEITNKSGKNLRVTKIEKKIHEKPIRIYDLTIDKYHNYFVTENEILVHNKAITS